MQSPQKHCAVGYLLLSQSTLFPHIADIVLYHHVEWSWANSQKTLEIPIPEKAYIIHLADRLDMLINDKYSILEQRGTIMHAIQEEKGKTFHPAVVDAFVELAYRESFWLWGISGQATEGISLDKPEESSVPLSTKELLDFIRILALIIDYKSHFTATHSSGVAATAAAMGEITGLEDPLNLTIAGYLHDLGKLVVPNEILEKKGPLNKMERAIINSHSFYSYSLLNEAPGLQHIARIAGLHQEKVDGTGYPFHPSLDDFPMPSRLPAVCDVFTALAEDRPYRKGMTKEQTLETMQGMVDGGHLDADCFKYLLRHYEQLNAIRTAAQQEATEKYNDFWQRIDPIMAKIL